MVGCVGDETVGFFVGEESASAAAVLQFFHSTDLVLMDVFPLDGQVHDLREDSAFPVDGSVADPCLQASGHVVGYHLRGDVRGGTHFSDEGKILFPELMLRGFGIECLLKSLWVKAGNKIVDHGRYRGVPDAKNHDLVQLASVVGIRLNSDQKDVLDRLTFIMTSNGRYPISRHWAKQKIGPRHGGGWGHPGSWAYPSDDNIVDDILKVLDREYVK